MLVSSCINPNQPNGGYFAMDPAQARANMMNTNAIERDSQQFRQAERMGQAEAIEMATRNNPRVIRSTTIVVP